MTVASTAEKKTQLHLSTLKTNVSWEDQQSAVYTVESMKKEIESLLTPKPDLESTAKKAK
jgi:hypothetical protein